jgi:hypothetical protein
LMATSLRGGMPMGTLAALLLPHSSFPTGSSSWEHSSPPAPSVCAGGPLAGAPCARAGSTWT